MVDVKDLNTWIEISRSAYKKNISLFKNIIGKETELSVVIKANAYGHGITEIAQYARENGVSQFCVHSLDEAIRLRNREFNEKILLIGPVPLGRLDSVVEHNLSIVAYNIESIEELNRKAAARGKSSGVHLKVETGTNRQGLDSEEMKKFLKTLRDLSNVRLEGVYSHFANIEDTTNHDYAKRQLDRYLDHVKTIEEYGFFDFRKHFASSAATILFKKTHLNMVRLGIAQYGLWPSKETYLSYLIENGHGPHHILNPVLSWKTRISQIKEVPQGSSIGYGCTYRTTRDSKIAILPIGYSDGYNRKLSNQGYVLIKGRRAPVRGRIAMNLTVVDVTDIPDAELEDEVVLIGNQGDEIIRAEDLAALIGTINYEVVTAISPYIRRVSVD